MTDALSELAREQREDTQSESAPESASESASKKRKLVPQPRPVYVFPDAPSSKENAYLSLFEEDCRDYATDTIINDFKAADRIYSSLHEEDVFGEDMHKDDAPSWNTNHNRLIHDIATLVRTERIREMKRRVSLSVGASMQ